MLCQFRVRACAARTSTTAARVRRHLLARAIDTGARNLPHARNARHAITASQGGREYLAHRLDLLWAKGRLPSSASILAESSSLSMVISPTLDFSRAISSSRFAFFQGCSRACERTLAPLDQPGDRDIRLPRHQFQRLA